VNRYARLALVLAAPLILAGCPWDDPFPEYRDVNLIEDRGLSVDSFSHAYMDGTDPATMFEYVRVSAALTEAEYGTAAGLPSGVAATIRRLEAVNLFPNGDFEASVAGLPPADWDVTLPAPPTAVPATFVVDDTNQITGRSVEFAVAGAQAAVLDLDIFLLDGFAEPATYFLSLQYIRQSATNVMTFDYGDDATTSYLVEQNVPWTVDGRTDGETPVETLPTSGDPLLNKATTFAASGTGVNYFYVGSPQTAPGQGGYLDNIRLGRLDKVPHVAVPVSLENADGELPLVRGFYRVSIWVKSEIADQVTPRPDGQNRFRAGQIVLGVNDSLKLFTKEEVGWTADTWQLVSAVFKLETEDLANDPPMQVRLSVVHPDSPVVGSVLIADPRVEIAYD
jgi:hypothetical protein